MLPPGATRLVDTDSAESEASDRPESTRDEHSKGSPTRVRAGATELKVTGIMTLNSFATEFQENVASAWLPRRKSTGSSESRGGTGLSQGPWQLFRRRRGSSIRIQMPTHKQLLVPGRVQITAPKPERPYGERPQAIPGQANLKRQGFEKCRL